MEQKENIAKPIINQTTVPPIVTVAKTAIADSLPLSKENEPVNQEEKEKQEIQGLIPQEPFLMSPLFYEIANYFGVDQQEYDEAKNKLSEIVDWAIARGKSNKIEDILTHVRKVEQLMMNPSWGEKRYKHVYRYVRLASQRDSMNKALAAFEKGEQNGSQW